MSDRVREVLGRLKRQGSARAREDMLKRYGIVAPKAYGVPMNAIQRLAKSLGRDHDLALALWSTGWYEARLLAAYVDQPEQVSSAQMDRWAKDFDNWGVCDTLCFCLFDRTPHAWRKVAQWAGRRDEFVKRAAFALLASLALHDKATGDPPFLATLPLIERAAADQRNFVKKGVSWALRSIGRRSPALRAASVDLARRLAASEQPAERWVGRDAVRELTKGEKAARR
ncbi:MAG TPA: DNA alkylation repair protein [Gemmatimonadales bacterium]|nr:DNA alkylation repair protein [Gemmatimonadales bacterium]